MMPPKSQFAAIVIIIFTILNFVLFFLHGDMLALILGIFMLWLNWDTFRYVYYRYIKFW